MADDLTQQLRDTATWCRLKQILSTAILADEDDTDKRELLAFMTVHWAGHAPREIEMASMTTQLTKLRTLLDIPEKTSHGCIYSHMVVICREQEATVTSFTELKPAYDHYDKAGAQWSDSYLTKVLLGPKV